MTDHNDLVCFQEMNPLDCRGLSLIEIMVSVMILLTTIAGFMTTYSYFSRQVTKSQQKRSATRFAQKTLEEYMADPNFLKRKPINKDITIDSQRNLEGTLEIKFFPEEIISDSKWREIECGIHWTDGNISLTTIWGK